MAHEPLTLGELKKKAIEFRQAFASSPIPELFGVTDGKAIGTHIEHAFKQYLAKFFTYDMGNSAGGIDFPGLEVDLKVTSRTQPQSSSPYKHASQKVYGLGYHLLVFVYEKHDDPKSRTARLSFPYCFFVEKHRTGDYQTTKGLLDILDRDGNKDDIVAFLIERMLPLDDIGLNELAERILHERPALGYLTISNALQWRLQFGRITRFIDEGDIPSGIQSLME